MPTNRAGAADFCWYQRKTKKNAVTVTRKLLTHSEISVTPKMCLSKRIKISVKSVLISVACFWQPDVLVLSCHFVLILRNCLVLSYFRFWRLRQSYQFFSSVYQFICLRATAVKNTCDGRRRYLRHPSHNKSLSMPMSGTADKDTGLI